MIIHEEEDEDSLFGSPPPSPQRPALSLPFTSICDTEPRLSTSTDDTQNVGTIALPGSHPYSELPIIPLALSLNHTQSQVHRPPAQSQAPSVPATALQQSHPWQPSPAQTTSKASKKSRQSSSSSSLSPSQSRDPEFSLPDPSAPPPAHFLRNQQNLLGKAGLVAGVKPSSITHIRGTAPSNPIIIDDEDTPIPTPQLQYRDTRYPYIDPDFLMAPTNEEIVSVLISQKDIFPVLNGILGLLGKVPSRHTDTTTSQSTDDYPSTKRRKLSRVPAGAADWDVPYPFQPGEGPDQYHKTWERERGKELVAQLVKLIKIAARKAATKNYLQQRERVRQSAREKLRQEIMPRTMQSEITHSRNDLDASITMPLSPLTNINQPPPPSQLSFDNLILSLVGATPDQYSGPAPTKSQDGNMLNPVDDSSTTTDKQGLFNTWMTLLQAFPVAFDTPPQSQSQSSPTTSKDSTPGLDDFVFTNTMGNDLGESFSTTGSSEDPDALFSSMLNSLPQDIPVPSSRDQQAVSPVPSISSSGVADPTTPTFSAWDMSMPDIFTGGGGDNAQGMFRHTLWDNFSQGAYRGSTVGGGWDEVGQITGDGMMGEENMTPKAGEGKGKAKEVLSTNPLGCLSEDAMPPPIETQSVDIAPSTNEQQECPTPVQDPQPPLARPKNTFSQSRKEEILKYARAKRKEVQEELDRVKTQLWETTIEQAALIQLLKRHE